MVFEPRGFGLGNKGLGPGLDHSYLDARLPEGGQLVLEDVCELSLADAISVHDDAVRLVAARALVEHHEVLPHHGGQVLDDVLPLLLHSHCGRVSKQNIYKSFIGCSGEINVYGFLVLRVEK